MTPQQLLVTFTDTHLPHLVPRPLRSTVHGEVTDVTMLVPVNSDSTRLVRRCRFTSEPGAFRLLTVPVVLLWGEALTARRFILDSSEESSSVPNAQSTLRDHGPSVRHADRPSLVQAPPDARRDRHVRHCHGDRRRGSAGNRQRRRAVPAGDPREDPLRQLHRSRVAARRWRRQERRHFHHRGLGEPTRDPVHRSPLGRS